MGEQVSERELIKFLINEILETTKINSTLFLIALITIIKMFIDVS